MKRQHWRDVLVISEAEPRRSVVRRAYREYRREQGIPDRCDNRECRFYTEPLVWNGTPFRPILDHIDGNRYDNLPRSLRYLCPICDSQLDTRGGKNRGRVLEVTDRFGYKLQNRDGTVVVAATGGITCGSVVGGVGEAVRK